MACRIILGESRAARLVVSDPGDRAGIDCLSTAAALLLREGRRIVIDLGGAVPATVDLLQALARILVDVHDPEQLLLRRPDLTTRQFLHLRGLDRFVVVDA